MLGRTGPPPRPGDCRQDSSTTCHSAHAPRRDARTIRAFGGLTAAYEEVQVHPRSASTPPTRRTGPAFGALVMAALLAAGMLPAATSPAAAAVGATTTVLETSAATLQTHHSITLTATVTPDTLPPPDLSGSVTFHDTFGTDDVDLGVVDVVGGQAQLVVASLAVGTHTITAEYAGDVNFEDSTSDPVTVTVTADTVEASGVGLSAGRFFPKVDGYKDTLKIKGTRLEPLAVAIVIKNAKGKTVRSKTISKAAGAYAWAWNGRNAGGTLQPAGRYTIRQTLRDGYTKLVVAKTVTLSWKRLYWSTYTSTRSWTQRSWINSARTAAGWTFVVPRARIYGKIKAGVYANGNGGLYVRAAACGGSAWNYFCYYGRSFSTSRYVWRSTSAPSGGGFVSSTRKVRLMVAGGSGGVNVSRVKLTLRWAVLR